MNLLSRSGIGRETFAIGETIRARDNPRRRDDGHGFDYQITVTDPVMLAQPWQRGGSLISWEDAELRTWNCGIE